MKAGGDCYLVPSCTIIFSPCFCDGARSPVLSSLCFSQTWKWNSAFHQLGVTLAAWTLNYQCVPRNAFLTKTSGNKSASQTSKETFDLIKCLLAHVMGWPRGGMDARWWGIGIVVSSSQVFSTPLSSSGRESSCPLLFHSGIPFVVDSPPQTYPMCLLCVLPWAAVFH